MFLYIKRELSLLIVVVVVVVVVVETRGIDLSVSSLMLALVSSRSLAISSLSTDSTSFTDLVQALQNQKETTVYFEDCQSDFVWFSAAMSNLIETFLSKTFLVCLKSIDYHNVGHMLCMQARPHRRKDQLPLRSLRNLRFP